MWGKGEKRDPLAALSGGLPHFLFFCGVLAHSHRGDLWRYLVWMGGVFALMILLPLADWQFRKRGVRRSVRIAVPVLAGLAGLTAMPVLLQTPLPRAIMAIITLLALWGGFGTLAAGFRWRVRTPPACAKCGYERGEVDELPVRCPECGAAWIKEGGIVEERTVRRPALIWSGAAMVLLGGSVFLSSHFSVSFGSGLLPTPALMMQLRGSQFFSDAAWAELQARTLTPEQHTELARILIDRRRADDLLSTAATGWLDKQVASASIPADLIDQFFADSLVIKLVGPSTAKVGQPVTLRLQGERRGYSRSYFAAGVVSGFFENETTEPSGRAHKLLPEFYFSRYSTENNPTCTFTPSAPGPARIRATFWVVVMTGSTWNTPVVWNEDGTPVLPPTTVWSKRYDLEHVINVRP